MMPKGSLSITWHRVASLCHDVTNNITKAAKPNDNAILLSDIRGLS